MALARLPLGLFRQGWAIQFKAFLLGINKLINKKKAHFKAPQSASTIFDAIEYGVIDILW